MNANHSSTEFYQKYRKEMYTAIYQLLPSSAVEDALQESMLKLWRKRDLLESKNDKVIKAYCIQTAIHTAYDFLHKKKRQEEHESLDPIEAYTETIPDTSQKSLEEIILAKDRIQCVTACIEELPQRSRELIFSRYYMGETDKEISKSMHIPSDRVRSQIYTAKQQLRRLLVAMEVEESGD